MMDEFNEKAIAARLRILADELDAGEALVWEFNTVIGMKSHITKNVVVRSPLSEFTTLRLEWHERQ